VKHYFCLRHATLWKAWGLPHHPRYGQPCTRSPFRGRNGNILVRFADGTLMVTPGQFARPLKKRSCQDRTIL
jgi:hypothetical protein